MTNTTLAQVGAEEQGVAADAAAPLPSAEPLRVSSAGAAAVTSAQWQLIETAPKDGTRILAWVGDAVLSIYWDAEFDFVWDEEADASKYEGAWTDDAVKSYGMEERNSYSPTHWMPPPEPPAMLAVAPKHGGQNDQ